MNALRLAHWTGPLNWIWAVFHFQISKRVRKLSLHVWTRNFRICQQGVPGQGTLQNNERIFQSQTSTSKKSKVHSGSEALCALLCHADYESFFLSASTFHAWSVARSRRTPGKTDAFQEFYNLFFQPAQNARWTLACVKVRTLNWSLFPCTSVWLI